MLWLRGIQGAFIILAVVSAALGAIWALDKMHDLGRQAALNDVRAAGEAVNVKLDTLSDTQEAIDAIVAAKVAEAMADARRVPSTFKYTAEQAEALNKIRRAAQ